MYVVNADTGVAWPLTCRRWRCPVCVKQKAKLAERIIQEGLDRAASAGMKLAHMTVTAPAGLSLDLLTERWKLLRQRLQRRGFMGNAYASVLGWNPQTDQFHLHVVIADSKYHPQKLVSQQAREVRLGQAHVKKVRSTAEDRLRLAEYLGRNLLAFRDAPRVDGARLRPFNPSRSWPGGTLTKPAWRTEVARGRFIVVGFTSDGLPWTRPVEDENDADDLLDAA